MSDHTSSDQNAPAQQTASRKTKTRAVLAGGVVLGLGAAMTLAAWTDSEFATGTFNTTKFGIEGSPDASTYSNHETAAKTATLSLASNATTMSPDTTIYTRYAIRTDASTTTDGTLKLTAVTSGGNTNLAALYDFKMATVASNSAACDATTAWNWIASSPVPAPSPTNATTPALNAAHAPVYICIAVHLSSDQAAVAAAANTTNATITWQWTGTSNA